MLNSLGHRHAQALALIVANAKSAMCGLAETYAMVSVLDSQRASEMELSISASVPDMMPYTYSIIPLETALGLNDSQNTRGVNHMNPSLSLSSSRCLLTGRTAS